MKMNYWLIVLFLLLAQIGVSQELTGMLRDAKRKPVKNHPVTLGTTHPVTVNTNRMGIFTISNANLNETLFITTKEGETVEIPVNGYPYLKISSFGADCQTNYLSEPDDEMTKTIARSRKMFYSSTLYRSDIDKSGCQDIYCLLTRMAVHVEPGGQVKVRGALSFTGGSSSSLIDLNGMLSNDGSILKSITIQDVEEITIVKEGTDYGTRGAEGVIVIKTRKR